jgi:hypothetical protein
MNLRDSSLLDNKDVLPQMRFLLNDSEALNLTVSLLAAGIKNSNSQNGDKKK